MKITKARLKQIIIEELEAVMKEDEDEEQIEEAGFISRSATDPPSHRDRPGYQRATLRGRGAPPEDAGPGASPTLDAAADALGLTPSDLMVRLAQEMGVELSSMGAAGPGEDAPVSERRRRRG